MVVAATDLPFAVLLTELHGCTKSKLGYNIFTQLLSQFLRNMGLIDECVKACVFILQEKTLIQLEKTLNMSRIINWAKN